MIKNRKYGKNCTSNWICLLFAIYVSIQNSIYIFSFSFSIWFLLDDNKDKIIFDFSSLLIDLILPLLVLGKYSFSFVFILSFFNNIFGRISLIIFTSSSEIEKFSRLLFCSLFIWLKVFIFFLNLLLNFCEINLKYLNHFLM